MEPGAELGCGLHLEARPHGLDQLAADRKAKPRSGKRVLTLLLSSAERLEQGGHRLRRNPPAGIAHRKLDPAGRYLARRHLDEAFGGELEGVGREVEKHPAERHRMTDAKVGVRRREAYGERLLLRDRLHLFPHRFANVGDVEWNG